MRSFIEGRCIRLVIVAGIVLSLGQAAMGAPCDRACLLQYAETFNRDILAHAPGKLPLAPSVQIRENTMPITLDASRWTAVKQIRSHGVYADPVLGNVIEHVAAEQDGGKIVYIGTRLKVADGKITEVEINFDDGPRVNPKNIIPYDPIFNTIVPVEDRSSRAQLESVITRYFQGLTDHKPVEADYDTRCDRFHAAIELRTTATMESRTAVVMMAAMRATSVPNRGDRRQRRASLWSIRNAAS